MRTIAPGKLILSGEHAVVYGRPALAMAVNRNAETWIVPEGGAGEISFALPNLSVEGESFSVRALREFRERLGRNYRDFLEGRLPIREVAKKPLDLFKFAFITALDGLHLKVREGIRVRTMSNIPIGCGMGSSAATVLSLLRGVGHYYRVEFRPEWYARYSMEVENLQHGKSSGLDTYVSMHGGCVRYQGGEGKALPLPRVPMWLVNTGTPSTTTGEAVSAVAKAFGAGAPIWEEFEKTAGRMEGALERNDGEGFRGAVRENERLLEEIGVVPGKVAEFAREVEAAGGAAKVCGAGAVGGEGGGVVLATGEKSPAELCAKYGYELMTVRADPMGVRVV